MTRLNRVRFCALSAALVLILLAATSPPALAQTYYINNNYHAQVTNYFCGAASMEMMLDTPLTTNPLSASYNQNVVNLLAYNGGDGAPVAPNPFPNTPPQGAQASIYSLVHGGAYAAQSVFGGAFAYNNPAYGPGTDPIGFVTGLNAVDNPNSAYNAQVSNLLGNGLTNNGNHQYAAIGGYSYFPPTVQAAYAASNTVASALINYGVPASVSVNYGGHWIDVNGVSVTGGYINGFYVRDPWTGYALANNMTNLGIGMNTYLRYGYDAFANGSTRVGGWFNYFTPATNAANAGYGPGYMIEVEPIGPQTPDAYNAYNPTVTPIAGNPLDADISGPTAGSDAASDVSADGLTADFTGGNWDTNNEMKAPMPGDVGNEGDWLVPYDGGPNDVTGFALIDEQTGVIDEATWFDAADGVSSISLQQLDNLFNAESMGSADPFDDAPLPEPSSWALMLIGAAGCGLFTWRRRSTCGGTAASSTALIG